MAPMPKAPPMSLRIRVGQGSRDVSGVPMDSYSVVHRKALIFRTNHAQDLNHRHYCPPSSGGNIPKIIYPFRLRTDPPGYGSRRYELSCKNVAIVLHLYSGKYYVQSINYNNYTIRVVDSNVEMVNSSDCMTTTSCINTTMSSFSSSSDLSSPNGYSYAKIGSTSVSEGDQWRALDLTGEPQCGGVTDRVRCRVRCSSCDDYWGLIDAARVEGFILTKFNTSGNVPALLFLGGRLVLGIPCVIALLIYKWRKRHLSLYHNNEEFLQTNKNLMPIRYSYSDIRKMTGVFKQKLGEGGYGCVYKGKLRSGRLVAIKVLGISKANGEDFINEVATIGRIHHVNAVQLVGFYVEGSKRALVYDFMPNGSLDKYIFSRERFNPLDCKKMCEISYGVASGIEYLHRGCNMRILHFDMKPPQRSFG
ncbi:hypothetical protein FNV43_RR24992 [Rhamnella rubrinervis]|uniref:Protein kinase domain-containing protein n=1 Tax=Rhamnella rubrinervis TaxID=2594499 RepID=A0A8K0DTD7_9ROSA|nr:hypothetical protein FNV43_RR24992 [Rhamnella rubrinervis]